MEHYKFNSSGINWDAVASTQFGTVGKVVAIQDEFANSMRQGQGAFSKFLTFQDEELKSKMLQSLNDLQAQLQGQESALLRRLFPGIAGQATDFEDLVRKINAELEIFSAKYKSLESFLNSEQLLAELREVFSLNELSEQFLNRVLTVGINEAEKEAKKVGTDLVLSIFNAAISSGKGTNNGKSNIGTYKNMSLQSKEGQEGYFFRFTKGKVVDYGVYRFVSFRPLTKPQSDWSEDEKKFPYTIHFDGRMPKTYSDRIQNLVNAETNKNEVTSKEKQLVQVIKKHLPGDLARYFSFEDIMKNFVWSGKSLAVNKGAIGEIYWMAVLKKLAGPSAAQKLFSTGRWQSNGKKQLPMDIILDSYNIQVKNYRSEGEGASRIIYYPFDYVELSKLLMATGDNEVFATLSNFVTSWGYNQDVSAIYPSSVKYAPIYGRFESRAQEFETNLHSTIQSRLIEYMRITHDAKMTDEIRERLNFSVGEDFQNMNTLYMFADKIVPASYIVNEIRRGIEGKSNLKVFLDYAKLENFKVSPNSSTVWPSLPAPTPKSAKEWGAAKVAYRIAIEVNGLLASLAK